MPGVDREKLKEMDMDRVRAMASNLSGCLAALDDYERFAALTLMVGAFIHAHEKETRGELFTSLICTISQNYMNDSIEEGTGTMVTDRPRSRA